MKRIITSLAFFTTFISLAFPDSAPVVAALFEAAKSGDLPRLQSLIAENADVNARDNRGNTALVNAVNAELLFVL